MKQTNFKINPMQITDIHRKRQKKTLSAKMPLNFIMFVC